MRKALLPFAVATIILSIHQSIRAQNVSPYWSLVGNSNASNTTSKLGTTNGINLRLFTNNLERARILSSTGYVGIGTTAPNTRLMVNSAAGAAPFRAQVAGNTKLLVHSNGGVAMGANVTPPINGLYVSGNVGLGTVTPSTKLHVVGSGRFTKGLLVDNGGVQSINASGTGVAGLGSDYGVYGRGFYGVYGIATDDIGYGVLGEGNIGVRGSGTGVGVYADGAYGVVAVGSSSPGDAIHGEAFSSSSNGATLYSDSADGIFSATGSSKAYAGYFSGNVFSTGMYLGSDRMLKQNIADVSSAMAIINRLQPKSYDYRQDGNYKLMNLPSGMHYGLIAQEVEQVLPGLVKTTTFLTAKATPIARPQPDVRPGKLTVPQHSETLSFKALNYTELIPIIIKGMQEQEEEIKAKDEKIAELETRLQKVEALLHAASNTVTFTSAYLEQNTPNPVRSTTSIRYHIQETATSAVLILTNAKGQVVKTLTLSNRGSGQIQLNTQALASGTYNYTLYVDGKTVDTKRLVITR